MISIDTIEHALWTYQCTLANPCRLAKSRKLNYKFSRENTFIVSISILEENIITHDSITWYPWK